MMEQTFRKFQRFIVESIQFGIKRGGEEMKAKIIYLTSAIVMAVALMAAMLPAIVAADSDPPEQPTDLCVAGEETYIFLDWFANLEEDVAAAVTVLERFLIAVSSDGSK